MHRWRGNKPTPTASHRHSAILQYSSILQCPVARHLASYSFLGKP